MSDMNKNRPTLFAASGFYLLAAIGLWIAMFFGSGIARGTAIIWPGATQEWLNLFLNIFYYLPFVALPVVIWTNLREDATEVLRLNPISFGTTVSCAIVALLSLMIVQNVSTIWMAILQKLGLNVFIDDYVRPANTSELTLSILSAAVIAPVAEEILFRGVMLSAWERRGAKKAVLTTAILFAMLHGSVLGLPGEIFGGMMLALLVLWTDSIYAGFIFHTTYNAGGVIMNYLTTAAPADAAEEALMQADIIGYMGGYGTVLVLLFDIVLMLAMILMFTRRMRMVYAFRRMASVIQNKPADGQPKVFHPNQLFGEIEKPDHSPMTAGGIIVLMSGIVSCAGMYFFDFISMLGG